MEKWKPIKYNKIDYTGIYEVSTFGRVRSLDRMINFRKSKKFQKGIYLKARPTKLGYNLIKLYKNGKTQDIPIHRLVANCFIRTVRKGEDVHHKNSIKNDNRLCNLEILTHRENCSIENTIKSGLPVGVHLSQDTKNGTYKSRITKKRIPIELGRYKKVDEAAEAYKVALKYIKLPILDMIKNVDKYRLSIGLEPVKRKKQI